MWSGETIRIQKQTKISIFCMFSLSVVSNIRNHSILHKDMKLNWINAYLTIIINNFLKFNSLEEMILVLHVCFIWRKGQVDTYIIIAAKNLVFFLNNISRTASALRAQRFQQTFLRDKKTKKNTFSVRTACSLFSGINIDFTFRKCYLCIN